MKIARDGLREILIAGGTVGLGAVAAAWAAWVVSPAYWGLAVPLMLVWLSVVAFFRDPNRQVPGEAGLLVAPADGKVTEISRLEHHEKIGGPAIRIGIFLSIADVHINRAPCAGRVVKTERKSGAFLDARNPQSGKLNTSNTVVIDPAADTAGPIIVRQIVGLIARRIVCNVGPGDVLERGQRFGMLKFGSRTELIVPADSGMDPAVQVNDHVKGGVTVLMKTPKPENAKTSLGGAALRGSHGGQGRPPHKGRPPNKGRPPHKDALAYDTRKATT